MVFSEPLNGDSPEGIIIGRMKLQARPEASLMWGINAERLRPAFAGAATRRQAQGPSEGHTDPLASYFQSITEELPFGSDSH
jgi:hypothetical protein